MGNWTEFDKFVERKGDKKLINISTNRGGDDILLVHIFPKKRHINFHI